MARVQRSTRLSIPVSKTTNPISKSTPAERQDLLAWNATDRAIIRYRAGIVDRQLVLERLANMAIELLATACVISRTQSLIDSQGLDGAGDELALCDLFCIESGRRFRTNRLALDGSEEEVDSTRRAAARVVRREKRYFVKDAILDL